MCRGDKDHAAAPLRSSMMPLYSGILMGMKAWRLYEVHDLTRNTSPLCLEDIPVPVPQDQEVLVKVSCCGVCHTDLDEAEGRLPPYRYPVVPGHQVVGVVAARGKNARRFREGARVGIAWVGWSCGVCEYCRSGQENLCSLFCATGKDYNGGYAEYMIIHEAYAYDIPDIFSDEEAAPLLCAGAIGYRSLKLAQIVDSQVLGLMGFGASGHLVLKMAHHLYPGAAILVFARSSEERAFARQLGATWVGGTGDAPPMKAHAIIDTTPAWAPVMAAMLQLRSGGRLVINAIRKESADLQALLTMQYQEHLWMEKEIKSVANITRLDVRDFLTLAAAIPLKPEVQVYPFTQANEALVDLRNKHVRGAKVLRWS
jgi:propanol-preferring alcohol dehydrogenase